MALDPSIILQAGRGVTPLMNPAEIQDQQMQREIGSYKLNALRQSQADDEAYRGVLRSGAAPDQLPNKLYAAGLGAQAQAAQKFQLEQTKAKRDAEKAEIEGHLKKFELAGQIMNGVNDQASWERARQQTAQVFGPEAAAQMPPQYDPVLVEQKRVQAMAVKDQLAQKLQARGQDITMRGQDLSQSTAIRGQDLTRDTALQGQAITTRGQDLTDTRAKERNATLAEEARIKREAAATSGPKMTEDQGKATGWLVQAENAFKNMEAVGFKDGKPTSAATPGVGDAVANIPMMGGVGNWMRGADRQKFVQASSSLSESLLRAATGAGVNKDEAKQKIEELTPQWGDSDQVISQKRAAIPLYIESLKVRAGPGAVKAGQIEAGAASPKPGAPQKIVDKAAFDALPSGSMFIAPDGTTRRKP